MWKTHYGDYDHLARVKEWSLTGGGDEGEIHERRRASFRPTCAACRSRPPTRDVSAFVSANAGSGKTHVLAQRVINLLLRGVDPAKILCITFTKAAAANMANRVFGTLAEWTTLDDAALDDEIRAQHRQASRCRRSARGRGGCSLRRWKRRAG